MACDTKSKEIVKAFLHSNNMFDVEDTDEYRRHEYVDLTATFMGKRYAFEVKERSFPSTSYGDIICESIKVQRANIDVENGRFASVYIINLFSDGVLALANMSNVVEVRDTECPNKTVFDDDSIVVKSICHFNQEKRFMIHDYGQHGIYIEKL